MCRILQNLLWTLVLKVIKSALYLVELLLKILPSDLNSEEGMADNEVPLDSDSHYGVDRAGQGYLGQGVEDGEDVRVDAELIPKGVLRGQSRNSEHHETVIRRPRCTHHNL